MAIGTSEINKQPSTASCTLHLADDPELQTVNLFPQYLQKVSLIEVFSLKGPSF